MKDPFRKYTRVAIFGNFITNFNYFRYNEQSEKIPLINCKLLKTSNEKSELVTQNKLERVHVTSHVTNISLFFVSDSKLRSDVKNIVYHVLSLFVYQPYDIPVKAACTNVKIILFKVMVPCSYTEFRQICHSHNCFLL